MKFPGILRRSSIRRQLIAGVAIVHLVLMSLFVADITERQRDFLTERAKTRALFQAQMLATSSVSYVIVDDLQGLSEVVEDFSHEATVRYAMVTDLNGTVLSHSDLSKRGQHLQDATSRAVLSSVKEPALLHLTALNVQAVAPITVGDRKIGVAWVGVNSAADQEHLAHVTKSGLLYTLIAVLVGAIFAVILASTITRPLLRLKLGAERLSRGLLHESIPATTENEVGVVTEAFNVAMQRLAAQAEDLRCARDELEKRVEARTRELAEANQVLAEQMAQTEAARRELFHAHSDLESRVAQRTAELAQTNQALELEIMERRRAEESEKQANALLALSNEELERFAYAASHDLQEPLRTIRSFVALLGSRYQGKLDAEADEFIEFIVNGAERMQSMIRDLLAFSRAGQSERPHIPVSCDEAFETAISNLRGAIQSEQARVTSDPLPNLMADQVELVQLFQNLVGNAIKYHGENPPLIHVSASRQEQGWLFEVRDNGIGVAPKDRERIFGAFQRVHGKRYPGTGVGLATCLRIVQRHHGRIWVESEPGSGSTFKFVLKDEAEWGAAPGSKAHA